MRVVFDTNIYVPAFVFPGGPAEAALRKVMDGAVNLVVSSPIIRELLGVMADKFARDPEELSHIAMFLSDLANVVEPRHVLHVLSDDPDNRILECAVTGCADIVVTGDRAMLKLGAYQGVRFLSLKGFLEVA
ncbi:MAG: putative toxin-antitoxin system toxin component, PIN family [Acidiferrobacteraceae bacterium]